MFALSGVQRELGRSTLAELRSRIGFRDHTMGTLGEDCAVPSDRVASASDELRHDKNKEQNNEPKDSTRNHDEHGASSAAPDVRSARQ